MNYENMTQQEMVLDWIARYGSITDLEAYSKLHIRRLADVIYKLQKKGYEFDHIPQTEKNAFGKKVHFMKYSFKFEE